MNSVPDFKSYADVTERLREIKELITAVNAVPVVVEEKIGLTYGLSIGQKTAVMARLMDMLTDIGSAPTRESISKEMIELEKTKSYVERVTEMASAAIARVDAFFEAKRIEQEEK